MAEVEDGTAPAAEEDAAASADVEVAEDEAGADTMAEVDDGTAPATEEDAAASAYVEVAEDEAGADTMAEADDGTAPAVAEDAAATAEAGGIGRRCRHRHHGAGRRRHRAYRRRGCSGYG